jgi:hypothetical protein
MLSEQTRRNIDHAFHRAARATVPRAAGDVCEITPAPGPRTAGQPEERLVLITVSSFAFRLITIFQIADNPSIRGYYLDGAGHQGIDEAFHEVANLCCGALNREFSRSFAHLAMSTPYTLDGRCIDFLDELKPQYLARFQITINDAVRLRATLCMCCAAPVDIQITADQAETTGELELF